MSEAKLKKRFGVKRWIILALFAAGFYAAFIGPSILKPVSPVVVLAPEHVGINIFGFEVTNTILSTLLADLVLVLIAYSAYRFVKRGKLVPAGFYNAFEALFEFLWNSVEGTAGKWAKRIFPITATIFLLIFVANMVKLIPGFESIGRLEQVAEGQGYAPAKLLQVGGLGIFTVDKGKPVTAEHTAGVVSEGESTEVCTSCEIIPYFRGSATDLNFPFALAIIAVVMTQVYGVWALGPGYFGKFFQLKQLISGGIFGMINFLVGFLELVLEIAKVLSFGFRLFGNIFAGALLVSIIGALVAVAVPAGLYFIEVFFGTIQAYVFFLLATAFISIAIASHHGEEHS